MTLPTFEQVLQQTGVSRKLAKEWGVPWPLRTGWKNRLVERIVNTKGPGLTFTRRGEERFEGFQLTISEREELLTEAKALLAAAHAELAAFLRSQEDRA